MTPLEELTAIALVGTDRNPPSWPTGWPGLSGTLGETLAAVADGDADPTVRLLRLAGVLAVAGSAGALPPPAPTPPPAPAPSPDPAPDLPPELVSTLAQLLQADAPTGLLREALQRLAAAGVALPPALLPAALALAVRDQSLAPLIRPVLGPRGDWLAALNPTWSGQQSAIGDDPASWTDGTLEQRETYLRTLRRSDPVRARELLEEGIGELDARARQRLVVTLETGLGDTDEPFLEGLLCDRSKEVRRHAAGLLAHLPRSAYVQRMAERIAGCLTPTKRFLRQVWIITPPSAFDPEWKPDGIEEAVPRGDALGARAWWLYSLARALPLSWWQGRLGLDPPACIRWARDGDWGDALLRAWGEAALRGAPEDWVPALQDHLPLGGLHLDPLALIRDLPLERREAHWLRLMGHKGKDAPTVVDVLSEMIRVLSAEGHDISPGAAPRVLTALGRALAHPVPGRHGTLQNVIPGLTAIMPPASLDALAETCAHTLSDSPADETLARVLAAIAQRRILIRHLPEPENP